MGIYNAQYDDYKRAVTLPDLTPAEKETLKIKKQVLTEAYPVIQAYDLTVASGGIPNKQSEDAVLALVDRLQRLAIRQVSK